MNFKPNEFFIGLVDFISIILPGSLFAAILLGIQANGKEGIYTFYKGDTSIAFWIAFVFVSFGVGHFLNSIASGIDGVYDWIRKCLFPYKENIIEKIINENYKCEKKNYKRELKNKSITVIEFEKNNKDLEEKAEKLYENYFIDYKWNRLRQFSHFLFEFDIEVFKDGLKVEKSYELALPLKNDHLGEKKYSTNVYKWSQALLDTYFPAVADQVNRSMAVSKFFRSLVLVSLMFIMLRIFGFLPDSVPLWMGGVLLILSFREYVVQRQKSVIAAYKGIVSLFHTSDKLAKKVEVKAEEKKTVNYW